MIAHIALWLAPATVLLVMVLALPRRMMAGWRLDVLEAAFWIVLVIGFVGAVL